MSSQAGKKAAELLDEFLDQALRGKTPSAGDYLKRCPESEVDGLRDALEGLKFVLQHQCTQVKESTVERTVERIRALKRAKQRFATAQQQAQQVWQGNMQDPVGYLAGILQFPAPEPPSTASAWMLQLTGRAGAVGSQPAVMHRGGRASAKDSARIDDVWIQAREQECALKVQELLGSPSTGRPPVDVRAVADRLHLFVQEAPLEAIEGCLVTDGTIGGILINSNVADWRRRRFTLAHEVGHFVLHRALRVFQDTEKETSNFSRSVEAEANIFASQLLVPSFLLPKHIGREMPSLDHADELVGTFEVSLLAALRRMVQESHWRCALVITKNGIIEWSVRSSLFDGYVASRRRVHPSTMASQLQHSAAPDEDVAELPAEAWLEGSLVDEDAQLREQSRWLEGDYIYSLLTMVEPA